MRLIVYTKPDGSVVVVRPLINTKGEKPGFTEADAEKRAWDKLPKEAINPCFVDTLTVDRTFRGAWAFNGKKVEVDMGKAREIHKDRLRALRAPKLAELDAEYMKADESGDEQKKAEIASKKQALRDVTKDPRIEKASTAEELNAVRPEVLG